MPPLTTTLIEKEPEPPANENSLTTNQNELVNLDSEAQKISGNVQTSTIATEVKVETNSGSQTSSAISTQTSSLIANASTVNTVPKTKSGETQTANAATPITTADNQTATSVLTTTVTVKVTFFLEKEHYC
jgi:hypothetical protein